MAWDRIWHGEGQVAASPAGRKGWLARIPPPLRLLLTMFAILAIWYGVIGTSLGGLFVDLATRPTPEDLPPGGSVAVGMAARLIVQQVDERAFTPNDPILYPTGLARRTPAFQNAVIATLSAATRALSAAEPTDKGLAAASRALETRPDLWWLRRQWPPIGLPAERHYLAAVEALRDSNRQRQAKGAHSPGPAAPHRLSPAGTALLTTLLGQVDRAAETGDRLIRDPSLGSRAVQLAQNRGVATAATLLLRGIREDEADAIRLSGRAARWSDAQDALDRAARLDPMIATERDLMTSGYALLVAGNAMRAILEGQ